jgi:UDP-N-acetylglucosamine transferase subunit ALG13
MFFEKNNGTNEGPRVLVAPLDWGLGHATRCIPIIYSLLNNGATVFLAADGPTKNLLEKELPQVVILPLPGYKMLYSHRAGWLPFKLLLQFPKLLLAVYNEHMWLKNACKTHRFDGIISDNRLGLYHNTVPCVYITHQLTIKTGNRFTEWLAQKIHYRFINKYRQCWVPDNENENSLAGDLSHPKLRPAIPVNYIGTLSRFEKKTVAKKYDLLVLLSGPEPQRTIFEELLIKQLKPFTKKVLLVRGLPGSDDTLPLKAGTLEIYNHLDAAALNNAILQSELILCRSGYTTIMDLVTLQQKAILVPTPGQTEQGYLGAYLNDKNMFRSVSQAEFSLESAMEYSNHFTPSIVNTDQTLYKKTVSDFVNSLREKTSS